MIHTIHIIHTIGCPDLFAFLCLIILTSSLFKKSFGAFLISNSNIKTSISGTFAMMHLAMIRLSFLSSFLEKNRGGQPDFTLKHIADLTLFHIQSSD